MEESDDEEESMGFVAGRARLLDAGSEPATAQAAIAPYIEDIDSYMRYLEKLRRPTDYMPVRPGVTASCRAILVDWLVELADEFNFPADTLHLAVSYVDRFLSVGAIVQRELQLLGATAMLLASKYESDMCTHKATDYSYMTDNSYTEQQVLKMETQILHLLKFEMGSPTARTFLRRYLSICPQGDVRKLEFLCSYLADLSLLEYDCTKFRPSIVAAACLFVARFTINPDSRPWNLVLQRRVGYKVSDLRCCILKIHRLQSIRSYPGIKEMAIKDKYSHCELECVSAMGSPREIPEYYLKDIKDLKNTTSKKWKRSRHI
ncbi:cyclin-A3-1-like [Lolium perenne]|uniref:cyclin-A3-1-like n=1 Tax=Lolium perenne TaxID=4522 RepID=UPI0021F5B05E|nr:cyclin-A3-1-like [Lolium perenne]